MTEGLTEIVEATGDEHHAVSKARFSIPKALLHNTHPLDPSQDVLGHDTNLANQPIVLLFLIGAFLSCLLLARLIGDDAFGSEALEGSILVQLAVGWKAKRGSLSQGFVVDRARSGRT